MKPRIGSIEKQLAKVQKRLKEAAAALSPEHKGGEMEEYHAAHAELMRLERELAAAKGEPYAVPADFPVKWDTGAPCPFFLCNDYRAFLTFYVSEPDPNWDGTYVNVVDPASPEAASLCLVTITGCVASKFGAPNDEVFHGHPLDGRGMDGYTAQVVKNSPWLAEVQKMNSVHSCYDPKHWESVKHFILWFHDNTFECLAESLETEVASETMESLLKRVCTKLLEQ